MSASREKRRRKELTTAADPNQAKEEQRKAKKEKAGMLAIKIGAIVLAVVFVLLLFYNTGVLHRTVNALTIGNHQVKVSELNYYYNGAYRSTVNNLGQYAEQYGLDPSKDLHKQTSILDEEKSWADYFYDSATSTLQSELVLSDKAAQEGLEMSDSFKEVYDQAVSTVKQYASQNGMTVGDYLKAMYGKGFNLKQFEKLTERSVIAAQYQEQIVDAMQYTLEDKEEYYSENPDSFNAYTYRSFFINGYDTDSDEESDVQMAAAKEKADDMAARLEAVTDLEEREKLYVELTPEYAGANFVSDYENDPDLTLTRSKGESGLEEYLKDFLVDESRQPGDIGVMDGTTGYYVVLFISYGRNEFQAVSYHQIYISPNSGTGSAEWTDEDWASAEQKAAEVFDFTKLDDFSVEKFEEYANVYSDDTTTASSGGKLTSALPGSMDTRVYEWLYGTEHSEGDTEVVKGTNGYYVLLFDSYDGVAWENSAETALKNRDYEAWYDENSADYNIVQHSVGMAMSDY